MTPRYRGNKGLVGIIANDAARYSMFAQCVTKLRLPPGWEIQWLIGGDWCRARNDLCDVVLDQGYSHLFFMDDDHAFSPDLLQRLTSWDGPEHAIVNPMCLMRTAPFAPVTFVSRDDDADLRYLPIDFGHQDGQGLIELEAAGCAGMLIRRDVIEAVKGYESDRLGESPPIFEYGDRSEDIVFCEKAKALGFKLWGDLGARLGHITTCIVIPDFIDGFWQTRLEMPGGFNVFTVPATDASWNPPRDPHPVDWPPGAEEEMMARIDHVTGEGGQSAADPTLCAICGGLATWVNPVTNVAGCEEHSPVNPAWDDYERADKCAIDGCSNTAGWTAADGRRGCSEHPETHVAWQTNYERVETWFDPERNRWYGRVLRSNGEIDHLHDATAFQEADLIGLMERAHPGLTVHHVENEFGDSRRQGRRGLSPRLWDGSAREFGGG